MVGAEGQCVHRVAARQIAFMIEVVLDVEQRNEVVAGDRQHLPVCPKPRRPEVQVMCGARLQCVSPLLEAHRAQSAKAKGFN